jgi:hypothetical protein
VGHCLKILYIRVTFIAKTIFMKHILPLVLFCFGFSAAFAQYSGTVSYSVSAPGGEMAKNIKLLHSAKMNIGRQLPGAFKRVQMGVELGIGTYALVTKEQTFVFDDGSSTRTKVNYNSNVFQAGAFTRIDLVQKGKVIPYLKGNAGLAKFYSNVAVQDPEDVDGCQPLEKKSLVKDNVFATGYGAGVRVDMNALCSRTKGGTEWLDFSVICVNGGDVDYINTKRLKDHYHTPTNTDPKSGQPVVQRFINATTRTPGGGVVYQSAEDVGIQDWLYRKILRVVYNSGSLVCGF